MEEKECQSFFKEDYTKEEINEVISWFEDKMDRLPKTLRLNPSTVSNDLAFTVKSLSSLLKAQQERMSVNYSGYVAHLMLIRQKLKEAGIE